MTYIDPLLSRSFALAVLVAVVGQTPLLAQTEIHRFTGESFDVELGHRVASAGDLDGDGIEDLLIARLETYNGPPKVTARSGGNGGILFEVLDPTGIEETVSALTSLGDVNGDGFADFAVATAGDYYSTPGIPVFSGAGGALLYTIPGYLTYSRFGEEMANAGDVNMDGVDDLIVGAPGFLNQTLLSEGHAFVFSGVDGAQLLAIHGTAQGNRLGWAVSGAGDVNGDGYADVAVGIPFADDPAADAGAVRVLSGLDGSLIREFKGTSADDRMGQAVCSPGDLDGDTVPDLVFSASPTHDEARSGATGALLYSIPVDNTYSTPEASAMAGVPDVDLDGVPDVLVTSWEGSSHDHYLAMLHSGVDGAFLLQVGGDSYKAFDGLEDVDGDGKGDLLVGLHTDSSFYSKGTTLVLSSGTFQAPGTAECFGDGGQVPCPCGDTVLYQEGFDGGVLPAGWTANSLWHVTTACAGTCGGDPFLYFGKDSDCTYSTGGQIPHDSVFSAPIAIPAQAQGTSLVLDMCWSLGWEGEAEDWWLEVHSTSGPGKKFLFDQMSQGTLLDFTEFLGQTIQLEFWVYTDGLWDDYPGWKIDDITLRWINNDGTQPEGCLNSTGRGSLLGALGSTSAAADDLRLFASQIPADLPAIFVVGTDAKVPPLPFGSGLICFSGQTHRYVGGAATSLGTMTLENPVANSGGLLVPGATYRFQTWHRDDPSVAPCQASSNLTNAYAVTLTP